MQNMFMCRVRWFTSRAHFIALVVLSVLSGAIGGCAVPAIEGLSPSATSTVIAAAETTSTSSQLRVDTISLILPDGWFVEGFNGDSGQIIHAASETEIQLTVLRFSDNGDTFQAAAAAATTAAANQAPSAVLRTLADNQANRQGTLIVQDDRIVAFVQPPQGGATVALRLEGPNTPQSLDLFTTLRVTSTNPTPPPDVAIEFVEARETAPGIWSFAVTLRHPDTGWSDYTDAWQVLAPNGQILGTRILLHPHETEQPFTRSLSGVEISEEIEAVEIVAHDLVSGFGDPLTIPIATSEENEIYRVERR